MAIRVEKLTKSYGSQKAVDSISFQTKPGEIVGFLGPNGAGKSTTMKMLACYLMPDSGNAFINSYSILEEPQKVKKNIGYLPENNPLYEDMYVREFLKFIARTYKIQKNVDEHIDYLIELTGITPELKKKIGQLSKGFRQRVGLAAALINNPDVLILDEPTSGLDPNQVIEIRSLIKKLGQNKSILLSSHVLHEVQAICDRVIIIHKGKLVADQPINHLLGSKQNFQVEVLFKKPVTQNMFQNIPEIIDFKRLSEQKWIFRSNNEVLAEKIFQFAVDTGNIILEMKRETTNLEEVFQKLTN